LCHFSKSLTTCIAEPTKFTGFAIPIEISTFNHSKWSKILKQFSYPSSNFNGEKKKGRLLTSLNSNRYYISECKDIFIPTKVASITSTQKPLYDVCGVLFSPCSGQSFFTRILMQLPLSKREQVPAQNQLAF